MAESASGTTTVHVTVPAAPSANLTSASGTASVHITVPSLQSGSGTTTVHIFSPSQSGSGTTTVHVSVPGPSVIIGPAITVDAGQPYMITPQQESAAAGSTITSRVWRVGGVQVGTGPSLTIIGTPSINGVAIVYSYTVTDSNSRTATDAVTVNALPVAVRGPGDVPMFVLGNVTGSGNMPSTEPTGFTRVYSEDFNDRGDGLGGAFPEGAFAVGAANTPNDGRILSTSAAYARFEPTVNLFPDGYPDTNGYAYNWPSRTVSTRTDIPGMNGAMQIRLRSETINGAVTALAAAVRPIVPGETAQERDYGRLSMRIQATGGLGFGAVMLMIANSTIAGEIDWFEGGLTQAIHGYFHGIDGSRTDIVTPSPAYLSTPHILTIERVPGAARCYLDDVLIRTITSQLTTARMKGLLQIGGDTGQPSANATGVVLVDWITVADYTG